MKSLTHLLNVINNLNFRLVGTAIYANTFAYYAGNGDPAPSSQPSSATPEPTFKCPCCRETTTQMLCATCATTALRLNKLRQQYKTLFHCKAEVCRHIDQQLKREVRRCKTSEWKMLLDFKIFLDRLNKTRFS